MSEPSLQERISVRINPSKNWIAQIIADEGESYNQLLREEILSRNKEFIQLPPFIPAIAESLLMGEYIQKEKYSTFVTLLSDYLLKDNFTIFDELPHLTRIQNEISLEDIVVNWKNILQNTSVDKIRSEDNALTIQKNQKELLDYAIRKKEKKNLKGTGAWLLLAPFKNLLLLRGKSFWEDSDADKILLPLGFQLERGVKFLGKYISVPNLVSDELNRGLAGDLAKIYDVQDFENELTNLCNPRSSIIHINTGLFLLGKKRSVPEA